MGFLGDSFSGLVNKITGTGTTRDKLTHSTWSFNRMQDQQLLNMYRGNWLAAKIVDIPIDDMLREGWRWQATQEETTLLEAEEARLGLRQKLHKVLIRDALYGGGAMIIGDGSANTEQAISPEDMTVGGLTYLIPTGRGELLVEELHEEVGPEYGTPKMFALATTKGNIKIHPSRVIAFNGQQIPSVAGGANPEDWWGDSRLSSVTRDIAAVTAGVMGMGRLMDELAVAYHKVKGLTERLAMQDGTDAVAKMLNLVNSMKSSINAAAIDAEDDVEIVTATFAGQPDALRALMQNLSGGADIPITRFLGTSPDGMNATGDSDTRNYYDKLSGRRSQYVAPGIAYLDQFLVRSAIGKYDGSVYRIWNSLWQLDDKDRAEYDGKVIEALGKASESGLAPDKALQTILRNVMVESPSFPGAETAFREVGGPGGTATDPAPGGAGTPPQRLRLVGTDKEIDLPEGMAVEELQKMIKDHCNK